MMRAGRRLARHAGGSTAIEFAVVGLSLFLLLLGSIEGGLLYWSWQALEGATIDAGRCAALNAPSCGNPATSTTATQNYVVAAAAQRGLSGMTAANVTVQTGAPAQASCGKTTASVVTVTATYTFPMISFVPLPSKLSASVCFPLAS
jgi:Flp pilus assembly protein TadG